MNRLEHRMGLVTGAAIAQAFVAAGACVIVSAIGESGGRAGRSRWPATSACT